MAAELQLIVDPAPSQGSHDHGWMKASLLFAGQHYWYGEAENGGTNDPTSSGHRTNS